MEERKRDVNGFGEEEINLRDYVNVILKRKKFIIVFTAVCFIATAGYGLLMSNIYQAKATLLIMSPKFKETQRVIIAGVPQDALTKSSMISELMPKSLSVEVYKGIATDPSLIKKIIVELSLKNETVEGLSRSLKVELLEDGRKQELPHPIMYLIAASKSPEKARDIANKWAELLIDKNKEINSRETSALYQFISNEYDRVKQNLEKTEEELNRIDKKTDLMSIKKELAKKRELVYGVSAGVNPQSTTMIFGNNKDKDYMSKLKEVENELALEKDPAKADKLTKEKEYLDSVIVRTKKDIDELNKKVEDIEIKRNTYLRNLKTYEDAYQAFSEKKISAEIANKEESTDIKVVSEAILPEKKIKPHRTAMALTGGFVGLFLGTFLAFLKESIEEK